MVARGRASAWGGAPHSCSPSAGGKRPRLIPPCLRPEVQEAATEGAETDAAGACSPLFRPRSVLGAGRRDCTRGVGQPGGSRGPATTCLLVIEFGVCHPSFLTWPSACTPDASQGGSCPERWGIRTRGPGSLAARTLPCGNCPSIPGADRSVSRRGEGGEDGPARVPCALPGSGRRPLHAA